MYDTGTRGGHVGQDDLLHELLTQLIRAVGLLEPDHPQVGQALSLSECFALSELAARAPLAQHELASLLNLEKSTVSRLVAGLERRNLLTRERKIDNYRVYQLRLTDAGRAAADQLAADLRSRHGRILATLTPHEREALTIGLSALLREIHSPRHHDGH